MEVREANHHLTPAVEAEHVHAMYERIAPHFSATRHSAWPRVSRFLRELQASAPCALVIDAGCGNGKYVGSEANSGNGVAGLTWLGLDRSNALLHLAAGALRARSPNSAADFVAADALRLPIRERSADAVICVAVLHHLSSAARRVAAMRELIRVVAPAHVSWLGLPVPGADADAVASDDITSPAETTSGLILVQAWALEQADGDGGGGTLGAAVPAPGSSAPHGADLLVPWRMPLADPDPAGDVSEASARLRAAALAAGGEYDAARRALIVHRFCHMFVAGELEALVRTAVEESGGVVCAATTACDSASSRRQLSCVAPPHALIVEVVASWWERGNHAIILRRLQ